MAPGTWVSWSAVLAKGVAARELSMDEGDASRRAIGQRGG
jgi:hypothetical protein